MDSDLMSHSLMDHHADQTLIRHGIVGETSDLCLWPKNFSSTLFGEFFYSQRCRRADHTVWIMTMVCDRKRDRAAFCSSYREIGGGFTEIEKFFRSPEWISSDTTQIDLFDLLRLLSLRIVGKYVSVFGEIKSS